MNFKYVFEYYQNANVKEMIGDVDSISNKSPNQKFSFDSGMSYDFQEPFNFYRCLYKKTKLNLADKFEKYNPLNDLYLFTDTDYQKSFADSFEVLKKYPQFNSVLLKKKYFPKKFTISFSEKNDYELFSNARQFEHSISDINFYSGTTSAVTGEKSEFSDGISLAIDTEKTHVKNSTLLVKAMVYMERLDNSDATLVVSFENKKEMYYWHGTPVNSFATNAKEWFPVYFSCIIPTEVKHHDKLMIYLWNKKTSVYIDNLEMKWITESN